MTMVEGKFSPPHAALRGARERYDEVDGVARSLDGRMVGLVQRMKISGDGG